MQLDFRQVREDEVDVYLALMHAAYAPVKALGIKFDAPRLTALQHYAICRIMACMRSTCVTRWFHQ